MPREGHYGGAEAQCRRLCRKVRHQVKRRRNLAETGEMMLGREGAAKTQRLRLDIVVDPIPIPGRTIGVRQSAFLPCAAKDTEFHANARSTSKLHLFIYAPKP